MADMTQKKLVESEKKKSPVDQQTTALSKSDGNDFNDLMSDNLHMAPNKQSSEQTNASQANSSEELSPEILALRAQAIQERELARQHWFRRAVCFTAAALWGSRASTTIEKFKASIGRSCLNTFIKFLKACATFIYHKTFVKGANIVWNARTSKLLRFSWKILPSPILNHVLNSAQRIQEAQTLQSAKKHGKSAWQTIAKVLITTIKLSGYYFHKCIFLCLEGFTPSTPMKAASFIKNNLGKRLASVAYYGTYAAGLTLGVMSFAAGGGFIAASFFGFFLAPSAAALANRAVMFAFTKGEYKKSGFKALKHWFNSKHNGPFRAMETADDAFRYKIIKCTQTGQPVSFFLCQPQAATIKFLTKHFEFEHETKGARGLVSHSIQIAHEWQSKKGSQDMLPRRDLIELTDQVYRSYEAIDNPKVFYPNQELTIAAYKEIEAAILEINPHGYQAQTKKKYRKLYLDKLVQLVGHELLKQNSEDYKELSLDQNFKNTIRNKLIPIDKPSYLVPPGRIAIRNLQQQDFNPSLPEFLITGGRIIGGFANTAGSIMATTGYLLQAMGKLLVSSEKLDESIGLKDLREIKQQIDDCIDKATNAEQAILQVIELSKLFIDKAELCMKPFASAFGKSAINSIILHTAIVPQNEMEYLNEATETDFICGLQPLADTQLKDTEKQRLIAKVEEFWLERGDEIIQDDYPILRNERRWYHWTASSFLYPKRVLTAVNNATSQVAAGDEEAQMLLTGMRYYYEERCVEAAENSFEWVRKRVNTLEQFLKNPENITE